MRGRHGWILFVWLAPAACGSSSTSTPDGGGVADGSLLDGPLSDGSLNDGSIADAAPPPDEVGPPDAAPVAPTCSGTPSGGAPTWAWDVPFGALAGADVAVSPRGAVVIVGQFNEPVDFGGGTRTPVGDADGFILQLDAQGVYQWDHEVGTAGLDIARSVAVDADGNVYVGGGVGGAFDFGGGTRSLSSGLLDAYVVSYDADGAYRWDADISGDSGSIGDLVGGVAASGGRLVAAGRFGGNIDLGLGLDSGANRISTFVVGLDPAGGTALWNTFLRASVGIEPYTVDLDSDGEPTVGGALNGDIDFGGGLRSSAGDDDAFVLHIDVDGDYLWDVTWGDTFLDDAFSAASLGKDVAVAGRFLGNVTVGTDSLSSAGSSDGVVLGAGPGGTVPWDHQWAGTNGDVANAVAASALDLFVAAGTIGPGTVNLGGADLTIASLSTACALVAYDATGVRQWELVRGGAGGAICNGMSAATGPGGVIVMTGQFQGSVDFGGGARTAVGPVDAYVVALCP